MTKQTEAERLADGNEKCANAWVEGSDAYKFRMDTAAELRRLSSFNQQLMDEVERLNKALDEWHDKTAWVQTTAQPMELGMHRADVLKQRIEALAAQPAFEPTKDEVQSAFEDWLEKTHPSGDVESIHRQWETSSECIDLYTTPPAQPRGEATLAREPKQQAAAVMPCGAVVSNVYEAYEAGKQAQPAREPLTPAQKIALAEDWFAEDWAITKAVGIMVEYEMRIAHGITKGQP